MLGTGLGALAAAYTFGGENVRIGALASAEAVEETIDAQELFAAVHGIRQDEGWVGRNKGIADENGRVVKLSALAGGAYDGRHFGGKAHEQRSLFVEGIGIAGAEGDAHGTHGASAGTVALHAVDGVDQGEVGLHSVAEVDEQIAKQAERMGQELAKEAPDLEKLREYQQMLAKGTETMLKRMDELYHSVQNNFITLVPTPLHEVCRAAEEHFARKYPEAKLTATVPLDVLVLCDRIHLAETSYNLLTNGYEAQVSAGRQEECLQLICQQERLWTVIEVRDRGNGITRQQRKHIYDPFYSSKNTNFNWGMGLYYVRATVKSHLGMLRVESRTGQGCSFYLQLPRYGSTNDLINEQGENA